MSALDRKAHERRRTALHIDFRRQLMTLLYVLVVGALAAAFYLITKL